MAHERTYAFQDFVLDLENACLHQGRKQHRLRPKAFAMLHYFVERPGQLVTKDELLRALWPNIVIDGATLTGCIRELRVVLNDNIKQPRSVVARLASPYAVRTDVAHGAGNRSRGHARLRYS